MPLDIEFSVFSNTKRVYMFFIVALDFSSVLVFISNMCLLIVIRSNDSLTSRIRQGENKTGLQPHFPPEPIKTHRRA